MRLVDKWLSISGLRKILGANGAEDCEQVVENQVVSDQAKNDRVGLRLVDKWLSISGLRKILGANGAEDCE